MEDTWQNSQFTPMKSVIRKFCYTIRMAEEHKILILGGGFTGVKCALELQKKNLKNVKITLISDRPHFEYHGALYRLVAGHSPLEVCIPLREILDERRVEIVQDSANKIDTQYREVKSVSGSTYAYDTLVIGLGGLVFLTFNVFPAMIMANRLLVSDSAYARVKG